MNLVTLDFETYYDKEYSLRRMNTEEYIRDPRFETILVGIKLNDGPSIPYYADEHDLQLVFDGYDIEGSAVLAHHAHFDMAILNWHYGRRPKVILDTLAMGRAEVGSAAALGGSLASLCAHFGIGTKGDYVSNMSGVHLRDMSPEMRRAYAAYCATDHDSDVNLTWRLDQILRPRFERRELQLIDVTTRLFTEPMLLLDGPLYAEFKEQEIARKATLLVSAGVVRSDLTSNEKFAEILRGLGVKPPMKPSPKRKDEEGKPIMTYAFAKDDDGLKDLLENGSDVVRAVVEARIGVKTSIMETRAQRYMDMAERGPAPIYIKYWGAEQTGRHSAGDSTNFLNLGRSKPLLPEHKAMGVSIVTPAGRALIAKISRDGQLLLTTKGEHKVRDCHQIGLRDGLVAPPGHKIVVGDSSNIEARMVVYIGGQDDILDGYRENVDQYCALAADVFNRPIDKKENPAERQMGKVGVLQLGFQSGKDKFFDTVRHWDFGADRDIMRPYQQNEELIHSIVDVFRAKYWAVAATWKDYTERVIPALSAREAVYLDRRGILQTTDRGTILMPGGRELRYPRLRWKENTPEERALAPRFRRDGEWVFDVREAKRLITTRIYGGKLFENVVQAAARKVVMDQTVIVSRKYRVVHSVYDEIICCVPEAQAEECEAVIKEALCTPPEWAPDFPLAAETGIGDFYGAAK